ncbi:MAG: DNA polymerase III subunit beta [Clostridiales bacterium]|nr:DNA polymerase III subunit beta [Clostridiales bacterium]
MKLSCNQTLLSRALNVTGKAVSSRTTIPILKGILLEATADGFLKLSASDLDISIEKKIPVTVTEPGSIVVSASLFTDIIKMLPSGEVEITVDEGNQVTVQCLTSEYSIVGQSADEFPGTGEIKEQETFVFDKARFQDMIRKTSFAASIDESKGIIVGILMELSEGEMTMVALDGFRMAVARDQAANLKQKKIIIAARILNEVQKILSDLDDSAEIKLVLDEKRGVIAAEDTKIVIRLLEGDFIRYKDILPKDHKCRVKANRKELADSIERASVMARKGKNNLIKLSISDDRILISSRSEEGFVKEELFVEKEGDDLEIGFNAKFILDVLKVLSDEEIIIDLNTSISPCLIKPLEGNAFEYLILPVRISG